MYRNTAAVAAFAALVFLGSAGAADAESARIDVKVDIRIAPDRSITETWHQETTPLAESAVRGAAESKWIVSGNETFEVIEAFTRKADGRVVPADPGDFVTQDGAVGAAMSFADVKLHQIPFRDLSVGDTTVLTVRSTEKEHYIPGQYSHPMVLAPSTARRTFDVTLRAPAAVEIRHDEQQLAYEEAKAGDEIVRHWSGTAAPITVEEKDVADVAFSLPGLRYSTFPSFEAIASSYYESAKPKLAVTPEIERLAEEITAGKQDRRAQAEAIFDWVSRNIRYIAVFFGNGRYVPNDTHTILSRRFGDCKDYAALLAALLAAKGIESEQVLIGVGADYRLPKTPTLQAFNHVIVYVPAFDRYLDPTVAFSSFDHPPSRDLDKPVVRVSSRGARLARTPRLGTEDNVVTLDSRVTMTRQGPQRGETTIEARGEFADALRAFVAEAEVKGKDLQLANLARLRGFLGTFAVQPDGAASQPVLRRPRAAPASLSCGMPRRQDRAHDRRGFAGGHRAGAAAGRHRALRAAVLLPAAMVGGKQPPAGPDRNQFLGHRHGMRAVPDQLGAHGVWCDRAKNQPGADIRVAADRLACASAGTRRATAQSRCLDGGPDPAGHAVESGSDN